MTKKVNLKLEFDTNSRIVTRYVRNHGEQTLAQLLGFYPARSLEPIPEAYMELTLDHFQLEPFIIPAGKGVPYGGEISVRSKAAGIGSALNEIRDESSLADEGGMLAAATASAEEFKEKLTDREAVTSAYQYELGQIGRFLRNGLSVMIQCDKILTEHIYRYVCDLAGKDALIDNVAITQGMEGKVPPPSPEDALSSAIKNLKDKEVLVLRSLEIFDTPQWIEVLYEGISGPKKPQMLGFIDPSIDIKKVLMDRFAVRIGLIGLRRYFEPERPSSGFVVDRLITSEERNRFQRYDAEKLFKNVAGLNPIQFRDAMRYVAAEMVTGKEDKKIFDLIRLFKTSNSAEIEIPEIDFDQIGGYDSVKDELKRIIALISGQIPNMSEAEQKRLIPRGFIFHGPPGTGKTLFAKAIANEMNATIQMVSGPEVMDKYVGQSESNLRQIFATARRNAPSIIFFDEFDSIAGKRTAGGDGGSRANNAVVAQLLTELDGFREDQTVLVIGTSNRLDIIDEALLRPSRLKPIQIGQPDPAARLEVAKLHAKDFGVLTILTELYQIVFDYLQIWETNSESLPEGLLNELFAYHSAYQTRNQLESEMITFQAHLVELFKFIKGSEKSMMQDKDREAEALPVEPIDSPLNATRRQIELLCAKYGIDPAKISEDDKLSNKDDQLSAGLQTTIQQDIRDLLLSVNNLGAEQGRLSDDQASKQSANRFINDLMLLISEYTEGFNNDEIRAIFQEASLEHHLEGRLVTPRYLGMKIGMIIKRREQRNTKHLV